MSTPSPHRQPANAAARLTDAVAPIRNVMSFLSVNLATGAAAGGARWWRGIHLVAAFALVLRMGLALGSEHVLHPDEIFQYLEQAHRLVYGYGEIPWEYRFGLRSWIIPMLVSAILWPVHKLGIDSPAVYIPVIKSVFCLVSVSLVYSAYVIGRNLASENAGRFAGLLVAVWYELIYFAHKPTPEVLSLYLLMAALACVTVWPRSPMPLRLGLLAGFCVILRPQYLPAVAVLLAVILPGGRWGKIVLACVAALLVIIATGFVDYFALGTFLASYYNYYVFNQVHGISGMFGLRPFYYYLSVIAIASAGVLAVTAPLGILVLRRTWLPLGLAATVIGVHSLIPHKEYRFILAAIPLLLVTLAIVVDSAASRRGWSGVPYVCVGIVAAVSMLGVLHKLPFETKVYRESLLTRNDHLEAYKALNRDPDLAALLDAAGPMGDSGGYYYLHRDVPIYFPEQLALRKLAVPNAALSFSHILSFSTDPAIPGFDTVRRIGRLEIRKQVNPPQRYAVPAYDTQAILFPGIDGVFTPAVRTRTAAPRALTP